MGELGAEAPVEQDTGLSCLALLLGFHQIPAEQSQLRHDLGHAAPADDADLVRLAKRLGARAKTATLSVTALQDSPLPAIVRSGFTQETMNTVCPSPTGQRTKELLSRRSRM